mgnify:CR=1 FL=1
MNTQSPIPETRRYVAVNPDDKSLSIEREATPVPAANEVLIKVHAAGLNRADLLQRQGLYPPPEDASPILGLEVAGEVLTTGADVSGWQPGDSICALTHGGGYADCTVAPVSQCLPIPDDYTMAQAAALPAVAIVLATIVAKKAADASLQAMCDLWGESLFAEEMQELDGSILSLAEGQEPD